jgi:hypothetical protein
MIAVALHAASLVKRVQRELEGRHTTGVWLQEGGARGVRAGTEGPTRAGWTAPGTLTLWRAAGGLPLPCFGLARACDVM